MAQRWDRRLVTIVAGPGFGKTALLTAALADADTRKSRDVWMSCEPADESADHLASGLAQALGLSQPSDVDSLCDAVWSHAPDVVCLVLDDVHEIPTGSSGAALLARLITDLPVNGHLVLASRAPVPVPTARLAANGQLTRIDEKALAFDDAELAAFASARGVDAALLTSTSGWPALAELTANAGADLVLPYLWEEVLTRIGARRASLLAAFAIVGGGDDEIVTALAGHDARVDDLVAAVPLVHRASGGWAALHPLWVPALRHVLSDAEADDARRRAADVHRRNGRFNEATELFAEAQAWDDLLDLIREVELRPWYHVPPAELVRSSRLLPSQRRNEAESLLAIAIEQQARSPAESVDTFRAAASAFRDRDDVTGELVAIGHEGLVRWWASDFAGLASLIERVNTLAEAGSSSAIALRAIAFAAIAHLGGDSAGVHQHLAGFDDEALASWLPVAQWLRSVAFRRDGDLDSARHALEDPAVSTGDNSYQVEMARLRIDWLDGRIDHVQAHLRDIALHYEEAAQRVLARDAILELACKTAFFGEIETTRDLLNRAFSITLVDVPSLHDILGLIAQAALAVAEGDESLAASLLADHAEAALEGPTSWYWRDRAAIALVYVLAPDTRVGWSQKRLHRVHRPGVELAEALVALRRNDLSCVGSLAWPAVGVIRAHLPARWAAELVAGGTAAGNPAPADLADALGAQARPALRAVAATSANRPVQVAAKRLLADMPAVPPFRLRICAVGPLELRRDDELVSHAELRRQRVRELLCYLVAHRTVRREIVAADLWPELDDGGHNLRVTLNYLQRALQPDRSDGEPPYFVRNDAQSLKLAPVAELEVDVWMLDAFLDEAARAEQAGSPASALKSYRAALPLWRGEPFADAPYATWAQTARARLHARYTAAAVRAGELLLAAREIAEARGAALCAITADPYSEVAHQLHIRSYLSDGDAIGAGRALEGCRAALRELDVEPQAATVALIG